MIARDHVNEPFAHLPSSGSPPEEPPKKHRKRRRGVALLPSLFTLGNCLCGFASINYASQAVDPNVDQVFALHFVIAACFIFAAMVFDMFDGFVARLTRSTSDFGAQLDSLADMVSFGIAPAYLSIHLIAQLVNTPSATGKDYLPLPSSDDVWLRLFWIIAGTYVSCTALRLARFNVTTQADVSSHMTFKGMPSPGAAAIVAGTVLFFQWLNPEARIPMKVPAATRDALTIVFSYLLPVVLLVSALLMVSRFSYSHLINRFLRGRKKFRNLVAYFLLFMLIAWQPQIAVIVGIYIYALSAPVAWLYRMVFKPKNPAPGFPVVTEKH